MVSLKKSYQEKRNQGFTIVELLIVIVVIGILALLVITTYSGIQAKARNAKRGSDVKVVQTQIEAFFSQNGYYPSLGDMNSISWRATNMKSLDATALVDPSSTCDPTATSAHCLVTAPAAKAYSYQVFQADGTTACESDDTQCAKYTLTATYEGTVNGQATAVAQNLD